MPEETRLIGSDTWTDGKENEGAFRVRAEYSKLAFTKTALLAHASSIRNGIKCSLHEKVNVGTFNLVTKIIFEDGLEWIARLKLPPIECFDKDGRSGVLLPQYVEGTHLSSYDIHLELDTMEFIRLHSDIPVPMVYGSDPRWKNDVGCPYAFLQYIRGSTADELIPTFGHQNSPGQYEEKLYRQVARIMHKLANMRMPKIGSVRRSPSNPEKFEIGPLAGTDSGPYESAKDFYTDYPTAVGQLHYGEIWEDGIHGQLIKHMRDTVSHFAPIQAPASGYGLANYDLGTNDLLVDQDFNVISVLGWEAVVAVPDEILCLFPFLLGVDCAIPRLVNEHPDYRTRQRHCFRFAEIVGQTSSEMARETKERHNEDATVLTRAGFFSKVALAYGALEHCKMELDWLNAEWARGLQGLVGRSDQEILDFYTKYEEELSREADPSEE